MSEENKPAENSSDQRIFEDLIRETPISSLKIQEPDLDAFDVNAVIEQARAEARKTSKPGRVFGKRTRKARDVQQVPQKEETEPQHETAPADEPTDDSAKTSPNQSPSYSELLQTEKLSEGRRAPRTFRELLNSDLLSENEDDQDEPLPASLVIRTPEIEQEEISPSDVPVVTSHRTEEIDVQPADESQTEPVQETVEEDEEILDPSASLVDDYNYDEYEDKKGFLMSDFKKIEDYLAEQSEQGYHYVRHEGKKYYFVKGKPHHYYYKLLYFFKEPSEEQFMEWADEGWKRINQAPSRHKRDAGWYVLRNEKEEGELPKDIENEEEKYRYFTKFSSSCRSTMFLLFIVMVCAALSVWLQMQLRGFLSVMIASAVLFVIALWIFLVYARMLSKSRKQASLLSARIRLADHDPEYLALRHPSESDDQLEDDWNRIGRSEEEDSQQ